ncbi:MAG: ABC transporter substrate-binding protein [Oscillospiraceae bacterium]|jgi:putative ABC transport system substrate-binding protein|nr:ABC transporter substrate-binding protein [Oscillospiraceae bacterium]
MKNLKKGIAALLAVLMCVALFACGGKTTPSASPSETPSESPSPSASAPVEPAKNYKVGIIQIVEHPSLDEVRTSFIAELAAKGFVDGQNITIDYKNGQGDMTNLNTIAQGFANDKYDIIVAIATPSAQAAQAATSEIPIVFSAVTDPVDAGLIDSLEKPGANITGTSDWISAVDIIKLANDLTPGFKTIGTIYNSGEANSVSTVNDLKAYAAENGLTIVEQPITNTSELQQAAQTLSNKCDIVFIPTDNAVASAMPIAAEVFNAAKIPLYVGADSMVTDGGFASYGVNYTNLGKETAAMVVDVLGGKAPAELPARAIPVTDIYINSVTAAILGVTIPEEILNNAKIVGE